MSKNLIVYFSATGTTKEAAESVAKLIDGDIFEIEPVQKYTDADLNWNDGNSRTSMEKNDEDFRPQIANKVKNIEGYENILIFFPVWWYKAPNIIYTFLDSYDFTNKTVIPFCTSGGTGISGCEEKLRKSYPAINFKNGLRISGNVSKEEIEKLLD